MTNSSPATAATPAVRSMIRWATPSRGRLIPVTRAPFVIVVTSLRPVRAGPGEPRPGQPRPGEAGPREAGPGQTGRLDTGPVLTRPREAGPGHAPPVAAVPEAGRPGGRAERATTHVELTLDEPAVDRHVYRAPGQFQRTHAGGQGEGLLRTDRGRCILGPGQVEQSLALLGRGRGRDRLRRAHQQCLHLVRRDPGALLDQQRRGTGDDCGGMRGAAAAEEALPDTGSRVLGVQQGTRGPDADHLVARGHKVGVARAVTVVGELRDDVVRRRGGAVARAAPDGDHVRVVGRVVDLRRPEALVAHGDDDDDALVPGLLGRIGQRVEQVALYTVGAERHVENTDVQAALVAVLDDPVDGRDGLRDVGLTLGVRDLDADDPGVRSHADEVRRVLALLPAGV